MRLYKVDRLLILPSIFPCLSVYVATFLPRHLSLPVHSATYLSTYLTTHSTKFSFSLSVCLSIIPVSNLLTVQLTKQLKILIPRSVDAAYVPEIFWKLDVYKQHFDPVSLSYNTLHLTFNILL